MSAADDWTRGITASRSAIRKCEWCRDADAQSEVELEPGRPLTKGRYKPAKKLHVCATCAIKVENLKAAPKTPTEVIRIA
jgi:hypothetical protein